MIYLSAEVVSGLGEDTFWTWFHREFPSSSFDPPTKLGPEDVVLRYSTLGPMKIPGRVVALLWELHPEMKRVYQSSQWDSVLARIYQCGRLSTHRVVASPAMLPFYEHLGQVDVLPIGVDTNLFRPLIEKDGLRAKHRIPQDRRVGIWVGTGHPMKGFQALAEYAKSVPEVHWIVVWKEAMDLACPFPATQFVRVPQAALVELMNAADFFACCGALRPFYMVEWEAMACRLPFVMLTEREFTPSSDARTDLIGRGWSRSEAKETWTKYLAKLGVTW